MNARLVQSIIDQLYSDSLRLTDLIREVDLLLVERAAQVEAMRRGITIGGTYLIRRPGLAAQRVTVRWIGGTADNLRLRIAKRPQKRVFVITVTPEMGVEKV